jgi:septal ring factor EnvC (AmiA/AmiB activator)
MVLALVLAIAAARAQTLQKEQNQVREKLAAQRAGLALVQGQQADVASALAKIDALARAAVQRSQAVAQEGRTLERQLSLAESQEGLARDALSHQLQRLGPRLLGLYRLTRRSRLDLLLSAPDVAEAFSRAWTLRKLLSADLALVDETQRVARYQDRARRRLEAMRELALAQRRTLAEARAREDENILGLKDALALLYAKARGSRQTVHELERADRELALLMRQLERAPSTSGFGALRGKLPLPAPGLVEVGFGRVVNPRFNTVVEHKGLDIRAAQGAPVKAVADGKVVWTGWLRGYGNLAIVDHGGGYHTLMAHLSAFTRQVGDTVKAGEEVAVVGDSGSLKGSYLYFEVRVRGLAVDPAAWMASL